jgi:hypothetical protein
VHEVHRFLLGEIETGGHGAEKKRAAGRTERRIIPGACRSGRVA